MQLFNQFSKKVYIHTYMCKCMYTHMIYNSLSLQFIKFVLWVTAPYHTYIFTGSFFSMPLFKAAILNRLLHYLNLRYYLQNLPTCQSNDKTGISSLKMFCCSMIISITTKQANWQVLKETKTNKMVTLRFYNLNIKGL